MYSIWRVFECFFIVVFCVIIISEYIKLLYEYIFNIIFVCKGKVVYVVCNSYNIIWKMGEIF